MSTATTYRSMPEVIPIPGEEWRKMRDLPFWCSNHGRFAYQYDGKLYLRKLAFNDGRVLFRFRVPGMRKQTAVVAKTSILNTFSPHQSKSKMVAQCRNGDERDIRLENLHWITMSEATSQGIAEKE